MDKLIKSSLDPDHATGKHKAVRFERTLGYDQDNAGDLRDVIAAGVRTAPARRHSEDTYGTRFQVDLLIRGPSGRTATVPTGWIYRAGETIPRLTPAFVVRSRSHAKATLS